MNQPGENPPPYEPTPAELEMVLDETNIELKGRPLARSPEQGIADMKARIELLSAQILKSDGQTPAWNGWRMICVKPSNGLVNIRPN